MTKLSSAVALFNRAASYVHRRLGRGAYLLLAGIFSVLIVVDLYYTHVIVVMERKTYDLMMRYRVNAARPDSGIVIVDIDERSLTIGRNRAGKLGPCPFTLRHTQRIAFDESCVVR